MGFVGDVVIQQPIIKTRNMKLYLTSNNFESLGLLLRSAGYYPVYVMTVQQQTVNSISNRLSSHV